MFIKLLSRGVVSLGTMAAFLAACGSGSGSGVGPGELNGARAQSYAFSCLESSCDSCRGDASDRYSECLRLCSSPYAPAGCLSQCPSIGDSSCSYACGDHERCDEWKADLPLPERDEGFFSACLQFGLTCTQASEEYVRARCDPNLPASTPAPPSTLAIGTGLHIVVRCPSPALSGPRSADGQRLAPSLVVPGARSTQAMKPSSIRSKVSCDRAWWT